MALLPDKYNFTIWKTATFRTRCVSYVDEGITLRDLTGYTAVCNIVDPKTSALLLGLTTANNRIALGGAAGTIDLIISATDTAAIAWKVGHYTLEITGPSGGDTLPLLTGRFQVKGP